MPAISHLYFFIISFVCYWFSCIEFIYLSVEDSAVLGLYKGLQGLYVQVLLYLQVYNVHRAQLQLFYCNAVRFFCGRKLLFSSLRPQKKRTALQ